MSQSVTERAGSRNRPETWPTRPTGVLMLTPRQKAPDLSVETLGLGRFDLADDAPQRFTLICFYRGLHCPICANYLKELERHTPAFAERGATTIAISSDNEERAR